MAHLRYANLLEISGYSYNLTVKPQVLQQVQ